MSAAATVRRRGRPPCCPTEVVLRVITLRAQGMSLAAISTVLNEEGVRTPSGRRVWQKFHVDRLVLTLRRILGCTSHHGPNLANALIVGLAPQPVALVGFDAGCLGGDGAG
jgi:hypothetical protein